MGADLWRRNRTWSALYIEPAGDGGFVIAWETRDTAQDGSGYAIKAQAFTAAGTPSGGEFLVNTQTATNQSGPAIITLADGNYVVAWTTAQPAEIGHSSEVKAQIFTPDGVKVGGEFMLNTQTIGGQNSVQLAALEGGGFAATWMLGSGAGAEMRHAMGIAVFAGMIGVTAFGIFMTPVFYVLMRALSGNRPLKRHGEVPHDAEPFGGGAVKALPAAPIHKDPQ